MSSNSCMLAIGDHHVWPIKMEQKKVQQIEKNQFIHLYTGCFDGEKKYPMYNSWILTPEEIFFPAWFL